MKFKVDFVLAFENDNSAKLKIISESSISSEITFIEEGNSSVLIINETYTECLSKWLDKTLQIIATNNINDFMQNIESSIIHVYLSAENLEDKFELNLKASQLIKLWELATVIDIDYGINFNPNLQE